MPRICPHTFDEILALICNGTIDSYKSLLQYFKASDISVAEKNYLIEHYLDLVAQGCAAELPPVMEIENATLQGCWQDANTGEKVSIEIIRNEDGSFNSYEIHSAGGSPITATDLADYEPCDDVELISINAC